MEDFGSLLMLCGLMFALTYAVGYLPMLCKLSETKLECISIFGAGFLLGTALIVIVPEGLSVLMESSGLLLAADHDQHNAVEHALHERVPTNLEQAIYEELAKDIDIQNMEEDDVDLHVLQARRLLLSGAHSMKIDINAGHGNAHEHEHHQAHEHEHHQAHEEEHAHHHTHDPLVHSVFRSMGCAICVGFIFMMAVEKVSAHSHGHAHSYHHKDHDTELLQLIEREKQTHAAHAHTSHHSHSGHVSNGEKEVFSFMVGLLTHSAVDGIALGAVSAEGNAHSLSILVFVALMAHKAPAAVSMTAFVKRKLNLCGAPEQIIKKTIIKQLIAFSSSAPIFALITYLLLTAFGSFMMDDVAGEGSSDDLETNASYAASSMLAYCLLFSGGTFLYVVTLHIIPEIKEWRAARTHTTNDEHQQPQESEEEHASLTWTDLLILSVGCVVPSLFEHSH